VNESDALLGEMGAAVADEDLEAAASTAHDLVRLVTELT
jgi:hypothetical protein